MKRLIAAFMIAVCLIPAVNAEASDPPELSAVSAILMDGESGRVLFEKNAHQERAIASITKLMTALLVVENTEVLDDEVVIKPEWTGIEGSSLYLKADETVTVETLLYGLLLHSGNDAAVALAGYCAGDVEAFVEQMNRKARELGMEHTHFTNPNGLSEEGHYSTAYDMALLGCSCAENELLARIMATKSIRMGTRVFTNHNKLLWRYKGCTGMKTGYTEKAGRTLVSSAERDGQTLIAVTLNAPSDWSDHERLFDYGFCTYQNQELCIAGQEVGRIPVEGSIVPFVPAHTATNRSFPLKHGESVETEILLPARVPAPVIKGATLGRVNYYLNGELIAEEELIAGKSVRRETTTHQGIFERIRNQLFN